MDHANNACHKRYGTIRAQTDFSFLARFRHLKVRTFLDCHLVPPFVPSMTQRGVFDVDLQLNGKIALVTGSSKGIGKLSPRRLR
jgi:hypothetical protein